MSHKKSVTNTQNSAQSFLAVDTFFLINNLSSITPFPFLPSFPFLSAMFVISSRLPFQCFLYKSIQQVLAQTFTASHKTGGRKEERAVNSEGENLIFCLLGAEHETLKDHSCWQQLLMCAFCWQSNFQFPSHKRLTAVKSSSSKETHCSSRCCSHDFICSSSHHHGTGLLQVHAQPNNSIALFLINICLKIIF